MKVTVLVLMKRCFNNKSFCEVERVAPEEMSSGKQAYLSRTPDVEELNGA